MIQLRHSIASTTPLFMLLQAPGRMTRSCRKELFGPVVLVTRFDDVDQAVA